MSVPLEPEHLALAATIGKFTDDRNLLAEARAALDDALATRPSFWGEMGRMGWLGLHLPEEVGGSGYGPLETAIVAEQLGRAITPGPFVPSAAVSYVIDRFGTEATRRAVLPRLADGTDLASFGLNGQVHLFDNYATGNTGLVLCGSLARWVAIGVGHDVILIDTTEDTVTATSEASVDPSRPMARIQLERTPYSLLSGAREALEDITRLLFAAEAAGVAAACAEQAVAYAKIREQFGQPIGSFQAVKHHCANMHVEAELAAALVWNAARELSPAASSAACAMAAAVALPAARSNAELNIRIHGGIGFTWENDAHLFLRRALASTSICDPERAAGHVTAAYAAGARPRTEIPPARIDRALAEELSGFLERVAELPESARNQAIVEAGYAVPHWPAPWGRDADIETQTAISNAFKAAGVDRPSYGITGWILYALLTHGSDDQIRRWVGQGLRQEDIWCQLFSEPDAGSDAAAVRTRATRVEGGWLLNGQKVWTTQADRASWGLATIRTDPSLPKHAGITAMVVDMRAKGVLIRPLRQLDGNDEFSEVFLEDAFVPDQNVVGSIGQGWTVARTTLAAESSSIGDGSSRIAVPLDALLSLWREQPHRLPGGEMRIGRYLARSQGIASLNLRTKVRQLTGYPPGPEAAVPKLVLADTIHDGVDLLVQLSGPEAALTTGSGGIASELGLRWLAMAIAGGTSEIKRNQIAERILGLPR